MELLREGWAEAWALLSSGDPLVFEAAWRSLWISTSAVSLAALCGLPLGTWVARRRFPGRFLVVVLGRAGMAVPTVFLGILTYAMFSRRGPLGSLELIFTPWAIVAGEFCLALPIIFSMTHGAVSSLDERLFETARTLGAGLFRRWGTYLSEARTGVLLGILTAFARCVTELGIAMMAGANIQGRTRTLATATALETGRGEFGRGLAMGFILLTMALGVTGILVWLAREEKKT